MEDVANPILARPGKVVVDEKVAAANAALIELYEGLCFQVVVFDAGDLAGAR